MEWTQRSQEAYRAYRDCPKPRSLRRAAGLYYHGDPNIEPSQAQLRQFKEWSRLLRWVDRLEWELSVAADRRFLHAHVEQSQVKEVAHIEHR